MRVILLGSPRPLRDNRWKDDIAESGESMGWDFVHVEALGSQPDDVVNLCKSADLFIWARMHNHDPIGDAHGMLRRIEDLGVPTVGIHMDLYWGIANREPRVGATDQPWWSCQYVFTADGGNHERFKERGVNHYWMPPAMGVRFFGRHEPARGSRRLSASFIGSNVRQIHTNHRSELINWAKRRYGNGFRHFGLAKKLYGSDINQMCSTTRVVLGDSAPSPFYWSDRIPNIMGRGGVLAYPRTEGLEQLGFNDDNMLMYDRFKFDELGERIDSMSDAELKSVSDAALGLIEGSHMWTHRLMQIKEMVLCGASTAAL